MSDFIEDYTDSPFYSSKQGKKYLTLSQKHREKLIDGSEKESSLDFIFDTKEVEDKYYLSEKVAKYILVGGTKTFKTSTKTDLDIARPLLQSMHKMHRAGVDNYVTSRLSR